MQGRGAVALNYLMEDTATAEIARSQIWQWMKHGAYLSDNRSVSRNLYESLRSDEVGALLQARGPENVGALDKAVDLLDDLVTSPSYIDFLTLPGYRFFGVS